jgi:hypothetical protein
MKKTFFGLCDLRDLCGEPWAVVSRGFSRKGIDMFRQSLAVVLCGALVGTGCASASGARVARAAQPTVQDNTLIAEYVQRIPAGSKVRVERTNGGTLRGTLMKSTPDAMVVQKNTRVPEPPVEVPLSEVTRVTLDTGSSSVGKTVAISVGAGVGATFGVILLLAAIFGGG